MTSEVGSPNISSLKQRLLSGRAWVFGDKSGEAVIGFATNLPWRVERMTELAMTFGRASMSPRRACRVLASGTKLCKDLACHSNHHRETTTDPRRLRRSL